MYCPQNPAFDVKDSSSTQLLLHKGNHSLALERWLNESPEQSFWTGLSRKPSYSLPLREAATSTQKVENLSTNNSRGGEAIKPDELRDLAQKVYAALGAK